MNRLPREEEQNTGPETYSVREILADYWAKAGEEPPAPAPSRSLSPSTLAALRAEEQEEGVRIYQPKQVRPRREEPLPPAPAGTLPPLQEPEKPEEPAEPARPRYAQKPRAMDALSGLLARLGKGKTAPEPEPAPAEEKELPSFEELLWGAKKKKSAPVRIVEEDEPVKTAPAPAPAPAPRPTPEVRISDEELQSLSVDAILADYWGGLSDEPVSPEPQPLSRAARRAAREPERREQNRPARREKRTEPPAASPREAQPPKGESRPSDAGEKKVEEPREPEPFSGRRKGEAGAPAVETAPVSKPAPASVKDAASMSVDDILSEFWAGYTEEPAEPAPRENAPRSRREAGRMREERGPVPPTGAASSAAENDRGARRGKRNPVPVIDEEEDEVEEPRPRKQRKKHRQAEPVLPEQRETPPPAAPEAVDPAEPAALFGFLRPGPPRPPLKAEREKRVEPAPAPRLKPEPAPAPAPRPKPEPAPAPPRERKHEDVDVGAMSVDDILAEYNDILAALPAAASAIGAEKAAEAEAAKGSTVSRMQREARSFIEEMKSENYASLQEESAYNRPRPKPEQPARPSPRAKPAPAPAPAKAEPAAEMPNLADAQWNDSLRRLLEQDPPPPQTAPEPSASVSPAPRAGRRYSDDGEIDPRFNLSGQRKSSMVFGDKELDLSADESYVPPKASDKVGFHWVAGEEELPEQPIEKKPLFRRKKKDAAPAPVSQEAEDPVRSEGFDDRKRPEYAPDEEYVDVDDEGPGSYPSFGQYLSGLFSGLLVRLLGVRSGKGDASGTMEIEEEDLGPEVSPAAASKYYGSFVLGLRMRLRIGLVLLAVMAWIALGLPVSGSLRSAPVAAGLVMAIQLTIMLLALDVVTGAAVNLARGRFGADSLAVITCVLTSLDALAVCLGALGTPHMPLCLISSASLMGVLLSSLTSARGLRKALRVPAIGKRCYGVTAEAEVKGSGLTLLKSLRPPKGFVRRTEEAAPDEDVFTRLSPILAVLALFMALIVAVAKHAYSEFLYILTALLCPAVPLTALLAFALPFLFGSLRIFQSGAAIAGWSGVSDIGRSENLVVTDRDLFPEGSVEIDTVRIFAEVEPETIISYAGTMICASGSDLAPCFAQLMEKNNCPMRRVEGFEYLAGGGMKGVIDGSVILCGGLDLMRLMNVRVPYRLVSKTTVLLSVDGILCGIFNMKYEGQPQVRKALVGLIRSNRHPIFAIRDFLVTPDMLSECFDVATDGYDFPPYVDRFAISEAQPSADSKLSAVVCREGLGPLVHMADTGRSMYLATRINLLLTVLAAVIGVFLVFVKLLSAGTVGTGFLLLFLLLWALPVAAVSVLLRL